MLIQFSKYHGTGNDFIMIDNRDLNLQLSQSQIAELCNRRFGIGADGLILLEMKERVVHMVYFNSDGAPSSMCGNGARCFVDFCRTLNILEDEGEFLAVDGMHPFKMVDGLPSIKMSDVTEIETLREDVILDTGSPHYVRIVDDVLTINVVEEGRAIRNTKRFAENGINVNFIEMMDGIMHIRTYERGVEDETLSCGTGATAVAIASHYMGATYETEIPIKVVGGTLNITFSPNEDLSYSNVWLTGPTTLVFEASIELPV